MRILCCRVIQNWDWLSFILRKKPRLLYFSPRVMLSFNKQINRPTRSANYTIKQILNQSTNQSLSMHCIHPLPAVQSKENVFILCKLQEQIKYSINSSQEQMIHCIVFSTQNFKHSLNMNGKCIFNPMQSCSIHCSPFKLYVRNWGSVLSIFVTMEWTETNKQIITWYQWYIHLKLHDFNFYVKCLWMYMNQ